MSTVIAAFGRFCLAVIFVVSGAGKMLALTAAEAELQRVGLPGGIALPVGIFEMAAGLCLMFGFATRLIAPLLIAFLALTTLFYHRAWADPNQLAHGLKNLAMIGGLLLAMAYEWARQGQARLRADFAGSIIDRHNRDRALAERDVPGPAHAER